jgi:protein TonB
MSGLAEAELDAPDAVGRRVRMLAIIVVVALFAAAVWWLKGMLGSPAGAKRQVAKISILPDTPPPPPPPPKEEKRPEPPRVEPKQVVRAEQSKPEAPKLVSQPIKMEGAAGEGPSAFSAGPVTKEYQGGTPITGTPSTGGSIADRAQDRFYANSARQLLRDEIERHLKPEAGEVVATFVLWIDADGRIKKIELAPGVAGNAETDIRSALDETTRQLRLPAPGSITQPLRFRMTMRAVG